MYFFSFYNFFFDLLLFEIHVYFIDDFSFCWLSLFGLQNETGKHIESTGRLNKKPKYTFILWNSNTPSTPLQKKICIVLLHCFHYFAQISFQAALFNNWYAAVITVKYWYGQTVFFIYFYPCSICRKTWVCKFYFRSHVESSPDYVNVKSKTKLIVTRISLHIVISFRLSNKMHQSNLLHMMRDYEI